MQGLAHSRYLTDSGSVSGKGMGRRSLDHVCSVAIHEPNPFYGPQFPHQQTPQVHTQALVLDEPPPPVLGTWGEGMAAGGGE